jgi:cytochrome d ubiquinol oxidase subunit II
MSVSIDLSTVWACLLAFMVLMYVVADGFDLGCGILFAAERGRQDRDAMVNSIAPVWDGNETWLVMGGAGLLAVFPLAYSIILPALYPTVIGMLLALIFRGVAFEFRFRAHTGRGRALWDLVFFGGSTAAALCQGLTLGGLLQGIRVVDESYAGGWWDWLTPFTVLCGVAVVVGYALLGATWLVWRTSGGLHDRARRQAFWLGWATLGMIGAVSLWTPFLRGDLAHRWFSWPGILLTSPVPLLVGLLALGFFRSLARGRELAPFLCALGWFVLGFAGLGISLFPLIVPPSLTIWDAAAPRDSQVFLLAGAAVMIPVIMAYSGYAYWVFRGKVQHDAGYH